MMKMETFEEELKKGRQEPYTTVEEAVNNTIDWAIDVYRGTVTKPCRKCKQPTRAIVEVCCNCNYPKQGDDKDE